jgi:predicted amidohydrolase
VARTADQDPAIVVADLDAAEVARVREMNPIERDRIASLGTRNRLDVGAR